jgi:diguanylate cyclase (GGDEF)-like protein
MYKALALGALLVCSAVAQAYAPIAPLPGADDAVALGPYVDWLEDPRGALTLEEVLEPEQQRRLRHDAASTLNFGYTRSAYWLRFRLAGGAPAEAHLVLKIGFSTIDRIDLYAPRSAVGGGGYSHQAGGDSMRWSAREIKNRNFVFPIPAPAAPGAHDYYVRVASLSVLTIPMDLWRPSAFAERDREVQMALGLFYGLVLALALYNLMLCLAMRDRIYVYYVLFAASFAAYLLNFDGLAFQYLWPESVWWANHALPAALALTLAFGALFSDAFLDLARFSPRAHRALQGFGAAGGVLALLGATGWLLDYGEILRLVSVLGLAMAGLAIYAAVRVLLAGFRPARFFLLAWGTLLAFVSVGALRNFALAPTTFATVYGLHIGFALGVVLLSFALADRINALKLATASAQAEVRERDHAMEQLRHMAQHDSLTGLPNRASMQQRLALAIELAKRNRKKLAVMMVDLDGFKRLNDERGHLFGDRALGLIAERLRTSVRGSDTVARYGGDEFVVLAGELDRGADAGTIAEKIADMMSLPLPIDGVTERVACSIGISLFPDDAQDAETLIERADRAMYGSKNTKLSQRYTFFSAA